jgi:hypothetical protein
MWSRPLSFNPDSVEGEVDYALERNVVLMQLPGREDTGTACVIRGRRGYSREIPVQQEKFSY